MPWLCLVCGLDYRGVDENPWGPDGASPTYRFCVCCGVEFGYGDVTLSAARKWRERWLQSGARWDEENHRPQGWDVDRQLSRLPERTRGPEVGDRNLEKVREIVGHSNDKAGLDTRSVTYWFSAFAESDSPPPEQLVRDLEDLGCEVVADEESSGDGFWHVAAFREETLLEPLLVEAVAQMIGLAEKTDSTFDGWDIRQ